MPERSDPGGASRRYLWLGLQLVGTALGLSYVLLTTDLDETWGALGRVSGSTVALSVLIVLLAIVVAAFRWRLLLVAYGAQRPPTIVDLSRFYVVGMFYNTFLPGGVGGDVVRGVMGRDAFDKDGVLKSMAVVVVERVLGLAGLLLVVSIAVLLRPVPIASGANLFAGLGVGAALVALFLLPALRRTPAFITGRIGDGLRSLPAMDKWWPALLALALSLGTQCISAAAGAVIWSDIAPDSGGLDPFVLVPLAAAAAFFPFTVGGAGVREGAFIFLADKFNMLTRADAAGVSLCLWFAQIIVALGGGVLQLLRRRSTRAGEETGS